MITAVFGESRGHNLGIWRKPRYYGENPGITDHGLESRGDFQNTAVFATGVFESRGLATGAFEYRGICSKLPVVLPTGSFNTAAHFHKGRDRSKY